MHRFRVIRVAIQQRVYPQYREQFFHELQVNCNLDVSLFTGQCQRGEGIKEQSQVDQCWHTRGTNIYVFRYGSGVVIQRGVVPWLKRVNPDVAIVEANPRLLSVYQTITWMHRRDRPVIGWGLGEIEGLESVSRIRAVARRALFRRLDGAIGYGSKAVDTFRQYGIPASRLFVAPNAVSRAPTTFPHFLVPKDVIELICVGRITQRKRLDRLIQACGRLKDRWNLILSIVGDGPDRKKCEQLATQVGVHCRFLGHLTGEDLKEAFRVSHIFVMPSLGGLAVQEALGFGMPVIAGRGDGTLVDMVDDENGWILQNDSEDELTNVLERAFIEKSKWPKMGERSFERAQDTFNVESMAVAFGRAIESIHDVGRVT